MWSHAGAAFGLGLALGASPGPVQLILLSESARGGLGRGFLAMAGANGTFAALLVALAAGLSLVAPSGAALRGLEILGGAFLVLVAVDALRASRAVPAGAAGDEPRRREIPPVLRGVLAVVLNPGAWLFLATTGSAVLADAATEAGRPAAFLTAGALMVGVSLADLATVLAGGWGRLLARRWGRWVRMAFAALLAALGAILLVRGVAP